MFKSTNTPSRCPSPNTWAALGLAVGMLCAGGVCAQERIEAAGALPGAPAQAVSAAPMRETLQLLARRYGICNVTATVLRSREIQSVDSAQGCASEAPLMPDSIFEAASLSKPVFAYAVLKLIAQGKMDLEAPVIRYLPNGYQHRSQVHLRDSPSAPVSDPRLAAVTVRMALNHTSGLPNWSSTPLSFDAPPGEKWQYSGEGFVLLQRAVEAVTRQDLDQFMAQQVFEPLGMAHSSYTRRPDTEKYLVPGAGRDGSPRTSPPFLVPVAAFTLYTSALDYGKFLSALLKDQAMLQQIVASPVPVSPKLNLTWGLGWGLEQSNGQTFLWHWGNNPGYRAFVMVSPRSGDGFVMLTNVDHGITLAEPLAEKILPGTHPSFRFPLLREGLDSLTCETFDLCL